MLKLPQWMGMGQEAKLSVPNSQWTNAGKVTRLWGGSRKTIQPPSGAAGTKQRSGEQRLRVGWGQRPKPEEVVDPGANPSDRGQHSKLNCPTFLGEELTKHSCGWRECSCCMVKTTALTNLHRLAILPHLTVLTNLVGRRNQILLISQSPGKSRSEFLLIHQYQDCTPKE
jgi:hypothetical protein